MFRNGLEPWHLLIVAIVIILVFGSKRLPEAARGLGKSLRILRSEAKAMKGDDGATPSATAPEEHTTATSASAPRLAPVASEATETAAPATENHAAH
ncbi:Sec-independent protein translocase subunit TatA [Streptomyces sp. NPDC020192]|uniref:Sec-independent protein translocase subunit TatA n=1 Tax=Streptomyces sp. NPDC020192 TaxID=3365066 RepID=UPI0037BDB7BB